MGIWRVDEQCSQMLQCSGDVGVGLVTYLRYMGVGTVLMKVNAVSMKVPI